MQTIIRLDCDRAEAHSTAVSNEWKGEKMLLDPENQGGGQAGSERRFRLLPLGLLRRFFRPRNSRIDACAMPESLLRDIGLRDGRRPRGATCGADELRTALLCHPPRSV
ncbi:hypothetical protein [Ciceribacter lividus]|uniref:hypothetical protein n=1 Tax=Ciceribacter lividus TaxID=1197950 RepID=UPI0011C03821|nr:hypothetical protein [Ciceribacter lividus]